MLCECIFTHKTQTNHIIKLKNAACLFPQQRPRDLHQEVPAFQAGTWKVLLHTLLFVVRVVHKIELTSPSSHCREKEPPWKHPFTLLCVVRVVHRIVLTSPSSHSHTCSVLSVFPSGSPGSCSASSSVSATSTSPKEDSSNSEESQILAPAPYDSPSHFPFSDSSHIWTTSPG